MNWLFNIFAAACAKPNFFGLPTWYEYLPRNPAPDCTPQFTSLSDVWLVVAAVIDILLRVAGLVAVIMIIYGGIEFITSQGEPDKAAKARGTIINAMIGLVLAIGAALIVSFIAGGFSAS